MRKLIILLLFMAGYSAIAQYQVPSNLAGEVVFGPFGIKGYDPATFAYPSNGDTSAFYIYGNLVTGKLMYMDPLTRTLHNFGDIDLYSIGLIDSLPPVPNGLQRLGARLYMQSAGLYPGLVDPYLQALYGQKSINLTPEQAKFPSPFIFKVGTGVAPYAYLPNGGIAHLFTGSYFMSKDGDVGYGFVVDDFSGVTPYQTAIKTLGTVNSVGSGLVNGVDTVKTTTTGAGIDALLRVVRTNGSISSVTIVVAGRQYAPNDILSFGLYKTDGSFATFTIPVQQVSITTGFVGFECRPQANFKQGIDVAAKVNTAQLGVTGNATVPYFYPTNIYTSGLNPIQIISGFTGRKLVTFNSQLNEEIWTGVKAGTGAAFSLNQAAYGKNGLVRNLHLADTLRPTFKGESEIAFDTKGTVYESGATAIDSFSYTSTGTATSTTSTKIAIPSITGAGNGLVLTIGTTQGSSAINITMNQNGTGYAGGDTLRITGFYGLTITFVVQKIGLGDIPKFAARFDKATIEEGYKLLRPVQDSDVPDPQPGERVEWWNGYFKKYKQKDLNGNVSSGNM